MPLPAEGAGEGAVEEAEGRSGEKKLGDVCMGPLT
jgi:hypothetical protein